jgi:hypothetical protein
MSVRSARRFRRQHQSGTPATSRVRPQVEPLECRSLLSLSLGTSFAGLNFSSTANANGGLGFTPPEPSIAVGPTTSDGGKVVEVTDSAIEIWNKSTGMPVAFPPSIASVSPNPQSLLSFFGTAQPTQASSAPYDPVATYDDNPDPHTGQGHFIITALEHPSATNPNSYLDVAISVNSDPSDFTSWSFGLYRFQIPATGGNDWAKFDRVGFNRTALTITTNMYSSSTGPFSNVEMISIPASAFPTSGTGGGQQVVPAPVYMTNLNSLGGALQAAFSVVPAMMHGDSITDPTQDPMWFVEEAGIENGRNNIRVLESPDVLTMSPAPTFVSTDFPVPSYVAPQNAPQKGGGPLKTGDTRILSAAWSNGQLVATQTIGVPGNGVTGVANARLYDFTNLGLSNGVPSASVELGSNITPAGVSTFFPAADIAPSGAIGMTYMQSSSSQYLSMYVAGGTSNGMPTVPLTAQLAMAGQATYTGFDGSPSLVGVYSGIGFDPSSSNGFWAVSEYATRSRGTNWGTHIVEFTVS